MMLRNSIALKLDLHVTAVNALLVGEQGEKSVPVENVINVYGKKLQDCDGILIDLKRDVMWNSEEIYNLKGFMQFNIALSCCDIIKSIILMIQMK
jgi:malate/lactate dehydrogenase